MKKHLPKLLPIAVALGLTGLGMSKMAWADSESSSFRVGIEVVATCSISAADMTFNTITTGTTAQTDAASDITVNCSLDAPYQISLSNGSNFSAGRRLANGNHFINYSLFQDPSRATQWDTANTLNFTGNGSDQVHTVYGRVAAGQSVPNMGSYSDTIVATITY
ncbi:MAG: spore coat U domain-containing protein [Burkholderiaceae bacterium]